MRRRMLKSKIHRATVTQAELMYEGSLTLDTTLMAKANMIPFEQVQVLNVNNGERFETYLIPGKKDSGVVCLNGPAARLGTVGDEVIVITYANFEESELSTYKPTIVFVNKKNKIVKKN